MPIYEYRCAKCGHEFEAIVGRSAKAACPSCGGRKLEKQLSVFAVSSGGERDSTPSAGPCGSCGDPRGPGSCGLN